MAVVFLLLLMPNLATAKSPPPVPVNSLADCRSQLIVSPQRRRMAATPSGCVPLRQGQRAAEGIPRVIHQVWVSTQKHGRSSGVRTIDLPQRNRNSSATWQKLMPDYVHKIWGNEEIRDLIRANYPRLLPTYDGYQLDVMRADAARYVIVGAVGGLYVDSDVTLLRPLPDEWFARPDVPLLFFSDVGGCGTVQWIFASTAGHDFWDLVVDGLIHVGTIVDVLFATGPPFFGRSFAVARMIGFEHSVLNISTVVFSPNVAECGYLVHNFASTWGSSLKKWVLQTCGCNVKDPGAGMQVQQPNGCVHGCMRARNVTTVKEFFRDRLPTFGTSFQRRFQACAGANAKLPPVYSNGPRHMTCVASGQSRADKLKIPRGPVLPWSGSPNENSKTILPIGASGCRKGMGWMGWHVHVYPTGN